MDQQDARRFDQPVRFTLHGKAKEILYVADAGIALLHSWPIRTLRRERAMRAVLAALRDQRPISEARQAFVDATLELKIVQAA
jgi:hypothetical protein